MPEITRLGHVGIYCEDPIKMRDFYTSIVGLQISEEIPARGVCFLTSNTDYEHHELALFPASGANQPTQYLQQVSFKVGNLDHLREYFHRLQKENVQIESTVTHGFSCSIYFKDPEDNRVEIYYTTGFNTSPPVNEHIDLDTSNEDLMSVAGSFPTR
ncbi:MAG: glyoxalase [Planctomyces sp.]|nr:glyoxalase [Planctomyces sp.]